MGDENEADTRRGRPIHWDTVTGISSMVIALLALSSSFYSASQSRRHDRLSVFPMVMLLIQSYDEAGTPSISLSNQGLGPAIIQDVSFFDDRRLVGNVESIHTLNRVFEYFGLSYAASGLYINKSSVLKPGDTRRFLWADAERLHGQHDFSQRMFGITVAYCFCSVYEECWMYGGWPSVGDRPLEVADCQSPDYSKLWHHD